MTNYRAGLDDALFKEDFDKFSIVFRITSFTDMFECFFNGGNTRLLGISNLLLGQPGG